MRDDIIAAADSGQPEIKVLFDGGKRYVFTQNMLNFSALKYPGTKLEFIGGGATLIGRGATEEHWSPVLNADGRVRLYDKNRKEYVLYCNNLPLGKDFSHILLTEWYQSRIYEVTEVRAGAVYFRAENAEELNMDMEYAGTPPRFRLLYSGSTAPSADFGFVGNAGRLLSSYGAEFESFSMAGFVFSSNCNSGACLLDFTGLNTNSVKVSGCVFEGIHSNLVHVSSTPNFSFENNVVRNCYRSGVISDNNSKNTRVVGNSFEHCGLGLDMSVCVDCCGTDYYIADNKFVNFGSRAISVGVYFTVKQTNKSSGIVERNEMCYTSEWLDNLQEYTLMDTGAIYITTFSDDAVIRFNRIYNYSGMKDNRGIFCDDGASGFSIYGNIITGIAGSYAIDARRTPAIEVCSGGRIVNVNNYIGDNLLEGPLRFEGRLLGGNCRRKPDFFLCLGNSELPERTLSSLSFGGADVKIAYSGTRDGIVFFPAVSMWRVRRWKYYSEMKHYLKRDS